MGHLNIWVGMWGVCKMHVACVRTERPGPAGHFSALSSLFGLLCPGLWGHSQSRSQSSPQLPPDSQTQALNLTKAIKLWSLGAGVIAQWWDFCLAHY